MSYIAYLNGSKLDLLEGRPIAKTLQVNDLAKVDNRQSNYTNTFKILPTTNNVNILEKVYLVGNQSNLPYRKNTFDLIDAETGIHIIYKGWAIIKRTTDKSYELHVYDGNIDLYKAIENKKLSDLNLTLLAHEKTLNTVVTSWNNSKPYKYILADYNGKSLYAINKINLDYLIPSVKASYLLQQIQTYTGFVLQGDIFQSDAFLKWYLSYPKATPNINVKTLIYEGVNLPFIGSECNFSGGTFYTADLVLSANLKELKLTSQMLLEVEFTPTIITDCFTTYENTYDGDGNFTGTAEVQVCDPYTAVIYTRNGVLLANQGGSNGPKVVQNNDDILGAHGYTRNDVNNSFNIKIYKNSLGNIDFLNELSGLTIKDFLNELVWRFGLTIFPDKYKKIYTFKKLAEVTNLTNKIDWSNKFISKESESYIYSTYAQLNNLKHKYNETDVNYNDGSIAVSNVNLPDSKTIIQSKVYTPEFQTSKNLGFFSNVYKLWEKEIKDDSTVKYKDLQNHFYFISESDVVLNRIIGSEILVTEQPFVNAPVEKYSGLSYKESVSVYYSELSKLLDKSKILVFNMWLTTKDIADLDFSVPYYIEQESGNFLLNKVSNFVKGKPTKCEFIRIK